MDPDSNEVGASGGTVQAASGAVSLQIPAGALSQSTKITVEPAGSAPADPGLLGNTAFDFGPDGLQFAQPVELKLAYDRSAIPSGSTESGLGIYKQVGGGWQRVAGSQVNTATQQVSAPIVSFSVYAILSVGPPASLAKVSGDSQTGWIGVAVTEKPTVRVTDSNGRPVTGATVTFAASANGSADPATVSTNAEGLASTVWTLGDAGPNTLTASVTGAAWVSFDAHAVDPCAPVAIAEPWAGGVGVDGSLTSSDCVLPSGRFADLYRITTAAQTGLRLTLSSSAFEPFVLGYQPDRGQFLGEVPDNGEGVVHAYAIVAPGTYDVGASSRATNGATGSYHLAISGLSGYEGCRQFFITGGVSIDGEVKSSDCEDVYDNEPAVVRWYDGYNLLLQAGETATVTVTGQFPYRFTYWRGGSYVTGHFGAPAGSSRTHTVTATATEFYGFFVISEQHQGTGSYSLTAGVSGGTEAGLRGGATRLTDLLANPR